MSKYIHTPDSVSWQDLLHNNTLSPAQYVRLVMPNQNFNTVSQFLKRPLKRADLGIEVGSLNYIDKSPVRFIRTKALQKHSYLPDLNEETALPILPSSFVQMNLKEGDLIISKDSNIGEIVILDKDYPNFMLFGAIYRLPVKDEWRYYLLAFIKHDIFREQLDFMVPKGATIRHAKTKFLDCKIPLPNKNTEKVIRFVSLLTQAIVNKEKLIRQRHDNILNLIEEELLENQKSDEFAFSMPRFDEIKEHKRLDTGLYCEDYKHWYYYVKNYKYGFDNLIDRGFSYARGTSLEQNFRKTRIDSDVYLKGFYELFSPYGYIEKSSYIGTPTQLKKVKRGDIVFGGEGFGKGRTCIIIDENENVVTNYHGIRIINNKQNIIESIFVRCFLAFWREKGMIDNIGVGGSGGHCAPAYFPLVLIPNFPEAKQKEIASFYYNSKEYDTSDFTLENFLDKDNDFNSDAGIYELDRSVKRLKERLDIAIDNIVNDKESSMSF